MSTIQTAKIGATPQSSYDRGANNASSSAPQRGPDFLILAYAHSGHAVPLFASVVPHRPDHSELAHDDEPHDEPSTFGLRDHPNR